MALLHLQGLERDGERVERSKVTVKLSCSLVGGVNRLVPICEIVSRLVRTGKRKSSRPQVVVGHSKRRQVNSSSSTERV